MSQINQMNEQGTHLNPHQSAVFVGMMCAVVGFVLGILAGVVWQDRNWFLGLFGGGVLIGFVYAMQIVVGIINLKAEVVRRASEADDYAKRRLADAEFMREKAAVITARNGGMQNNLLGAPAAEDPTKKTIRVYIRGMGGKQSIAACDLKLIRYAIEECWPVAARERVDGRNGHVIQLWRHRDEGFTAVADFFCQIGTWYKDGNGYEWTTGIDMPLMRDWYARAAGSSASDMLPPPKPRGQDVEDVNAVILAK